MAQLDNEELISLGALNKVIQSKQMLLIQKEQELQKALTEARGLREQISMYERQAKNRESFASFFKSKDGVTKAYLPGNMGKWYKDVVEILQTPFHTDKKIVAKCAPHPNRVIKAGPDYASVLYRTFGVQRGPVGEVTSSAKQEVVDFASRSPPDTVVRACVFTCLQVFVFESLHLTLQEAEGPVLKMYRQTLFEQQGQGVDGAGNLRNLDRAAYERLLEQSGLLDRPPEQLRETLAKRIASAILPLFKAGFALQTKQEIFWKELERNNLDTTIYASIDAAWNFSARRLLSPDWYGIQAPAPGTPFDASWMIAEHDDGGLVIVTGGERTVKLCRAPALFWASSTDRFTEEQKQDYSSALVKRNVFLHGEHMPPSERAPEVIVRAHVLLDSFDLEDYPVLRATSKDKESAAAAGVVQQHHEGIPDGRTQTVEPSLMDTNNTGTEKDDKEVNAVAELRQHHSGNSTDDAELVNTLPAGPDNVGGVAQHGESETAPDATRQYNNEDSSMGNEVEMMNRPTTEPDAAGLEEEEGSEYTEGTASSGDASASP